MPPAQCAMNSLDDNGSSTIFKGGRNDPFHQNLLTVERCNQLTDLCRELNNLETLVREQMIPQMNCITLGTRNFYLWSLMRTVAVYLIDEANYQSQIKDEMEKRSLEIFKIVLDADLDIRKPKERTELLKDLKNRINTKIREKNQADQVNIIKSFLDNLFSILEEAL